MNSKVLLLAANPEKHNLRLEAEQRALIDAVYRSERQRQLRDSDAAAGSIDFVRIGAARLRDVPRMVQLHRPQALHFSGHGAANGTLIFEDEAGGRVPVGPDVLAALLSPFATRMRLVFLNACYSAALASQIVSAVDCCIGMGSAVEDADALLFAQAFYDLAALGCSVGQAFALGCEELRACGKTPGSHATPQLLTRPGLDAEQIFLMAARPGPAAVTAPPGWQPPPLPMTAPPIAQQLASEAVDRLTSGLLRRALNQLLCADADLTTFLQTKYPRCARQLGDNMQRGTKFNILLAHETDLARLRFHLLSFWLEENG